MSEQALSQDEVDALLRGVTGETEESPDSQAEGGVQPYDIGRQERIVRGRMPGLELINERAARQIRLGLYNFMRRSTEIAVGPVRVEKYSEFIRKLPVPTNINLINIEPLHGTALMVFDPNLVFRIVDSLFGGTGKVHMRVEGREFTATEQRVIARVLEVAFTAFDQAWEPVQPVKHSFVRSEMNTQFVNIATPTEVVVATTFSIDLGEGGGEIQVCLPYSMIEPIRDVLCSSMQGDRIEADERWLRLMQQQIRDAEVAVEVSLLDLPMAVRQLLELKPGDMIPIDLPDSVTARVDGVPVFKGSFGVHRGHYAMRIDEMTGDGSE